jgi:multicomponent Na+:H+ antiporter subunit E
VTLAGVNPGDLRAGIVAISAATETSLRLLPPGNVEISPVAFTNLVLRLWQSLVAGIDVSRRALDPQLPELPLRPGVVVFSPRLPGGRSEGFLHAELCTSCTSNWRRQTTAPRR